MKIRTDFVTNSSSSSFVVEVEIVTKNQDSIKLSVDPSDQYLGGGGEARIKINNKVIPTIASIEELYEYILTNVRFTDAEDVFYDTEPHPKKYNLKSIIEFLEKYNIEELSEEGYGYFEQVKKDVETFKAALEKTNINIDDVSQLIFTETHYAWGEFSDIEEYIDFESDDVDRTIQCFIKELTPDSDVEKFIECNYYPEAFELQWKTIFDLQSDKKTKITRLKIK